MARTDQPVDLNHLDRYTGGDRAINEEILGLFGEQCRECIGLLDTLAQNAMDAKSWLEVTHRLKGAARGIGAFDLGDAVAEAEKLHPDGSKDALMRVKQEAALVRGFIASYVKTPA